MSKPLLSIGMIFKDEIRCLERCMKSLQPLREVVNCELVMADTGATDGSREIAEKYADILFDFPWINDFAAARNAVMDRCSGKWYMSIDCDEWLGGNIAQLARFVEYNETHNFGAVNIRNYKSVDLDKGTEFTDFTANRLLRMSLGLRYEGAIHEHWVSKEEGTQNLLLLQEVLFHHDGYVYAEPGSAEKKHERNMTLLREKLRQNPKNLLVLMQCLESSNTNNDEYWDFIKQAIQGVKEKWHEWQLFGAPLLRYAALAAYNRGLPEVDEYVELAHQTFPDSIFTRVDVELISVGLCWRNDDYEGCIQHGERYLEALSDYDNGNYNRMDSMCSALVMGSPSWKLQTLIFMSASYLYMKEPEKAKDILTELDIGLVNVKQVGDLVRIFVHLYSRTDMDTSSLIRTLWERIGTPLPTQDRAKERRNEFIRISADVFLPVYWKKECEHEDFCRHAYKGFLPLKGDCILGDAAAILETDDVETLESMLSGVEDMDSLPIQAIIHALMHGVSYPLPDQPMTMEEMDILSSRMAQNKEGLFSLLQHTTEDTLGATIQKLYWSRSLALAAIRSFEWTCETTDESEQTQPDIEQGMAVVRAFSRIEKDFLPRCYSAEVLLENHLKVLPPMHRFGWYCIRAFDALDAGDAASYVRLLREGLAVCESVKEMVKFLLDHTPELQAPPAPSDELRNLADQIRTILAAYPPNDPAVEAIKGSEAYRKVAYLIDGLEPPVVGGLMQ